MPYDIQSPASMPATSATQQPAEVVAEDFVGLTVGQQKAFDLVKDGRNVCITGLGGTGKSYVLEKIIEWAKASEIKTLVCAPTGIAALNIGGTTIHRVLKITPDKLKNPNFKPSVRKGSLIAECDLMIVDEISMCRMDLFDCLSDTLKRAARIRAKAGRPCCQLVVVGDFCQLSPVISNDDRPILEEKYGRDVRGGYPFMGNEWNGWQFETVDLTQAVRQRDVDFVAALNKCRVGDMRGIRWIVGHAAGKPIPGAIIICGTNKMANEENAKKLNALPGGTTTYSAKKEGKVNAGDKKTDDSLTFKPGARVMALINDSPETFMNGSIGTVVECKKESVVVDFDGLGVAEVGYHGWEITEPRLVDGKIKYETIGTFVQIPLKLAWAITIHKSQGQTFDAATVYPYCWEAGQLYTALSRLTHVEGLYLAGPCYDSYLIASPDVKEFLDGVHADQRATPDRVG